MDNIIAWTLAVVGVVALIFLLAFLNAIVVTLLWNWLVPILLPSGPLATTITYWQAWGISVLCSILFKGGCTLAAKKD